MTHLETRASKQAGIQFDILVRVDMSRQNLLLLIRSLRQSASLGGVTLLADNSVSIKGESKEYPAYMCIYSCKSAGSMPLTATDTKARCKKCHYESVYKYLCFDRYCSLDLCQQKDTSITYHSLFQQPSSKKDSSS